LHANSLVVLKDDFVHASRGDEMVIRSVQAIPVSRSRV
jgi:hypothetical protein